MSKTILVHPNPGSGAFLTAGSRGRVFASRINPIFLIAYQQILGVKIIKKKLSIGLSFSLHV